MKRIKFFNLLVISLAITCVVAGCKKNPSSVTPLPGRAGKAPRGEPGPGAIMEPGPGASATAANPSGIAQLDERGHVGWTEDAKMFEADTVYFDYDSSAVKASEKSKIEKVADYFKSNSGHAVKVEGHCDERGTEEYNRSLGERRALAVREHLVRAGIAPERIETISYGEDRPADLGHTESAWKKNRRGVCVLLTPPK
jgi:peptidoglycan-associated lipoprotein